MTVQCKSKKGAEDWSEWQDLHANYKDLWYAAIHYKLVHNHNRVKEIKITYNNDIKVKYRLKPENKFAAAPVPGAIQALPIISNITSSAVTY